jgi:hypothetical protein
MVAEAHLWWLACEIHEWLALFVIRVFVSSLHSTLAFTDRPIYEVGSNIFRKCT